MCSHFLFCLINSRLINSQLINSQYVRAIAPITLPYRCFASAEACSGRACVWVRRRTWTSKA